MPDLLRDWPYVCGILVVAILLLYVLLFWVTRPKKTWNVIVRRGINHNTDCVYMTGLNECEARKVGSKLTPPVFIDGPNGVRHQISHIILAHLTYAQIDEAAARAGPARDAYISSFNEHIEKCLVCQKRYAKEVAALQR